MIRAKLRDNTGASITYALLLFLVCAVVSSVVITAGTAAAGRMSQSVESDQRYYNVTSAAELLIDLYDNVLVTTTKTTKNGVPSGTDITEVKKDKDSEALDESTIYKKYRLLALASELYMNPTGGTFPSEMDITLGGVKIATAEVSLEALRGRMIFGISSFDEKSTDAYSLYLVFDSTPHTAEDTRVEDSDKIVTTVTTMTWKLTRISADKPESWE